MFPAFRRRAALRRPVRGFLLCVLPMALAAGCASYQRKPLASDELVRALEQRSLQAQELQTASDAQYNPEDGLALEEAEVVALFYNPSLRSARLRAQVPVLAAKEAGRWDDPELGADVLRILDNVDKPWLTGVSLAFTVPISGRLSAERRKATAEGDVALLEAWAAEQQVLRELHETWIEHEAMSRSASTSAELVAQLNDVVAITGRLEKAGELATAEATAFRLSKARADVELAALEAAAGKARRRLLSLMGLPADAAVEIKASADVKELGETPTRETLLLRNPGVLLRRAEYDASEESLRLEIRKQYPDLKLGPLYGNEDGQNRLGVGFSLPLPVLNANKQGVVEATAKREAARGAWEESIHDALANLVDADATLADSIRRHAAVSETVAPLAESQLSQARRLAEQGEVNALLLLEALGRRSEAALDLIQAEADVKMARAAVLALAPDEPPAVEPVANDATPAR